MRLICENVIDMITVLDSNYVCVYASQSFHQDNVDPGDLTGKEFLSYVHGEDVEKFRRVLDNVSDDYHYRRVRFRFGGGGRAFWRIKEATINVLIADNESQIMVVMRDTTDSVMHERERAALEKELQTRNSELERTLVEMKEMQKGLVQSEKLASIGHLVAGVAHIIRLQRKNFDGTGEPVADPVKGKDIPLGSRILKILLDLEMKSTDHFKGRDVLKKMKSMYKVYDPDLILVLLGGPPSPEAKRPDATVPVRRLTVGMVLLEDLVTQNGQLLLRRSATPTETICKLLNQWGNLDPIVSPVHVLLNQDGE